MAAHEVNANDSVYTQNHCIFRFRSVKKVTEEEYEKMLHLNDHKRLAMGKSVVNYFLVLYSVITRYAETKKEGKKIEKKRTKKMKQKQNKRKKYVR